MRNATDWNRVRDYLIASMLTHRSEIEANDYFYYRDSKTLRWSLIPWDHNNGNFGMQGPGNGPGQPFIALYGQTLRKEYFDGLAAAVNTWLLSGRVDEMAHRNFETLKDEVVLDPFRWRPGHDKPFLTSPDRLKSFNATHGRRLLEMIAEESRKPLPAVVIKLC